MGFSNKDRTYTLIGTSTGLAGALLATGLFIYNKQKIYLIIISSVLIIAFIISIVIVSLIYKPEGPIIDMWYSEYDSATNSHSYFIIITPGFSSLFSPITSYTVTAEYLSGNNSNKKDITFTSQSDVTKIPILLPAENTYKISVFATNSIGNSYPAGATQLSGRGR